MTESCNWLSAAMVVGRELCSASLDAGYAAESSKKAPSTLTKQTPIAESRFKISNLNNAHLFPLQ